MKPSRWIVLVGLVIASCGLVLGCNSSHIALSPSSPIELTISAAASLQDAVSDIETLYHDKNPDTTLTLNFGSSGALQQQIEQGAPVDIFFSAAAKQMDALQHDGLLLPDTRRDLLNNQVVLITPSTPSAVKTFDDLAKGTVQRIAIGDPASVPIGMYSAEVLKALGLWEKVQPHLILAKDVRQVLSYVETGNVDAGMVYLTDAKVSNQVNVVAIAPPESHSPVVYPVAVLKRSQHPEAANAFLEFLISDKAVDVFQRYGFGVAPK